MLATGTAIVAVLAAGGFIVLAGLLIVFRPKRPGYKMTWFVQVSREREQGRTEDKHGGGDSGVSPDNPDKE